MERRRAIAWAGSIALFGCAAALTIGSLAGGFGFDSSQAPQTQAIGPGPKPQPPQQRPAPDGAQGQPAPSSPRPETAPSDPGPAAPGAGARPAADPAADTAPDGHHPRGPDGYAKLSMVVPLAQTSVPAGSRNGPVPPREVTKPDTPAKKYKPPAPMPGKERHRDIPVVDAHKWVTEYFRAREIFEQFVRAEMRTVESSRAGKGASVRAKEHKVRGQDDGAR